MKSGHGLNNKLMRAIIADSDAWEEVSFRSEKKAPISFVSAVYG